MSEKKNEGTKEEWRRGGLEEERSKKRLIGWMARERRMRRRIRKEKGQVKGGESLILQNNLKVRETT